MCEARTLGDHLRGLAALADSIERDSVWWRAENNVFADIQRRIRESIFKALWAPNGEIGVVGITLKRVAADAEIISDEPKALPPPQKLIGGS
jgi:hypothetical protein